MEKVIISFLIAFLLIEFYVYQAFKTIYAGQYSRYIYWIPTLLVYLALFYFILTFTKGEKNYLKVQIIFSTILIFVLPKLLVALFLLVEDVFRLLGFSFSHFSNGANFYPSRRKFISIAGLGTAGILSLLFLDGIIFGKYRHKVRHIKLKFDNLPERFKGYKIIQISDVHSGSFQNPKNLQHAIDLINKQKADLVLFTGDMVNNYADEFAPFVDLFSKIKAKDGKFSVLGNHDYGDYGSWKNAEEKANNIPKLIDYQKQAGFRMLRNENVEIVREEEKIYLLGVENWGVAPFPQFGDLDKASHNVPKEAVKILMSHDPSHFDEVVKNHPSNIQLTLSGHTHGMQFGLDLKNYRWSPVKYRYKKWADLYKVGKQYLYVNRGFGVIGYPGRVGILPEITLIELI